MVYSFLGLCNKVPQTGQLQTMRTYSPTVVETKSPKSRCQKDHTPCRGSRKTPSLEVAYSWPLRRITPTSTFVFTFFPLCKPLFYLLVRTLVIGLGPILIHPGLNLLIISARILFPNKVMFWGSKQMRTWGKHFQPNIHGDKNVADTIKAVDFNRERQGNHLG